jgi:hypothetical protein
LSWSFDDAIAHQPGIEAMVFEWNTKIMTERFHALMTLADPFATKFANEFRILFEPVRPNSTSGSLARFKNCNLPRWALALECVGRGQAGKTGADNDAGVRTPLDKGTEKERDPESRNS